MPAGNRPQSSTMLYTLIIFVGLFIIATVFSVIYYVKAEDYRTKAATMENQLNEVASGAELRRMGTLVGARQARQSRLGTMLTYMDEAVSVILGGLAEETSAEMKIDKVQREFRNTLELLVEKYPDMGGIDPNTTGLIPLVREVNGKLEATIKTSLGLQNQIEEVQERFDAAVEATQAKEKVLLAEKARLQQQFNEVQSGYEELKKLLEQTAEERVTNLSDQLADARGANKDLNQALLKTQAQLKMSQAKLEDIQSQLESIVPVPDREIAAFQPDGKVILVDNQTGIVHIDVGREDRVYRGLTFSVYEKNAPIPKDGKGKAEIQVFDVDRRVSAARIVDSGTKRPVVAEDVIANLVWDSERENLFVVAGEFDVDGDGGIDSEGVAKIAALIGKWGGKVGESVVPQTDFLVLGEAPAIPAEPTFEQMEIDPMAQDRYEAAVAKRNRYEAVVKQSQMLSIPVFNLERFLYFIGYKGQSKEPGAF